MSAGDLSALPLPAARESNDSRQEGAGHDPVAPFADALRERFPSREALLAEARAQTRTRRRRLAGAGSALVAVLAAALWWIDPVLERSALHAGIGQQARATLADGSEVVLNTATDLRIERRLRSHRLKLERGEAAFRVAHGWRGFVVESGAVEVHDIGTAFNVRQRAAGVEVTVLEGAVEVREPLSAPRVLRTGQALLAGTADRAQPIRAVDPSSAAAWQSGRLVFDGAPLSAVVAELQRFRAAPLRLADEAAGRQRLSGAYDIAGLEALIDTLPRALPVKVRRLPGGEVTISSAPEKKS